MKLFSRKDPVQAELEKLKKQEEKFYCGIPTQEFRCSTVMKDQECPFRLYFYPELHLWKISWGE